MNRVKVDKLRRDPDRRKLVDQEPMARAAAEQQAAMELQFSEGGVANAQAPDAWQEIEAATRRLRP